MRNNLTEAGHGWYVFETCLTQMTLVCEHGFSSWGVSCELTMQCMRDEEVVPNRLAGAYQYHAHAERMEYVEKG